MPAGHPARRVIRAGIIGLDSTHAVEFGRRLNQHPPPSSRAATRVVAACRGEPTDLDLSVSRRDRIEREVREDLGIPVLASLRELVAAVDAIMILSCDGRCHRREAQAALAAGKPLFLDKPLAADWREAADLLRQARARSVPCFSASALRFRTGLADARSRLTARPLHVDVMVPKLSQPGHPDLLWHGIHGIESAYALLGPGCVSVQRHLQTDQDVTTGCWADGSTASIRRSEAAEAGTFPMRIRSGGEETRLDGFDYAPLLGAVSDFFLTRQPPVTGRETVETLAFAAASAASRRRGGAPVDLADYLAAEEFDL